MKYTLSIILFFLIPNILFAQWIELNGSSNFSFNDYTKNICTDSNGFIYTSGYFTNTNGNTFVAKWNGTNWSELGGENNSIFNGSILSMCADNKGNLYVAGAFTNTNRNWYVAVWDGKKWSELGGENKSNFNESISQIICDYNGHLYARGIFTDEHNERYIAKWNGNNWEKLEIPNNQYWMLNSMTSDHLGNIYLTTYNPTEPPYINVLKWDVKSWTVLGVFENTFEYGNVVAIEADLYGNVFCAGNFKNSDDEFYVAKWNGQIWKELNSTNESVFNNGISTLTTDIHGNLYAAGLFTNGNNDVYVAKWDGYKWSELGGENSSNLYWHIWDIEVLDNGNILTTAQLKSPNLKNCIAKYTVSDEYPDILTNYIFPNPTTESISIKGNYSEIQIIDVSGRIVLKKQSDEIKAITKIDVSHFQTGVYFFVGQTIEKQMTIQKFIKN